MQIQYIYSVSKLDAMVYREVNKGLYVVARNFFLLLLNCSAWPCLGPAQQDMQTFIFPSASGEENHVARSLGGKKASCFVLETELREPRNSVLDSRPQFHPAGSLTRIPPQPSILTLHSQWAAVGLGRSVLVTSLAAALDVTEKVTFNAHIGESEPCGENKILQ